MATYPSTYRSFRRSKTPYPLSIVPFTESLPSPIGPHDVIIRIHAVTLNYKDIAMLREGEYPASVISGGIPASDCAAEVVAIGSEVSQFEIGDHVAPTINFVQLTGEERDIGLSVPGADVEGVLREYAVYEEGVLVKLPAHLTWEEAATITCAGNAAWSSLDQLKDVKPDTTVLLQGTGGVSMFTLLICIATGIKPIITSSSDAKLEQIKKLSPDILGINYKTYPDVAEEALRLTDGKGVDYVINNTGPASIPNDVKMLRPRGGTVAIVGMLEGMKKDMPGELFATLLIKAARLQGILAASRKDFQDLNRFLEEKNIQLSPIIDRVFSFDDAPAAFKYLAEGNHVGKVVIKV